MATVELAQRRYRRARRRCDGAGRDTTCRDDRGDDRDDAQSAQHSGTDDTADVKRNPVAWSGANVIITGASRGIGRAVAVAAAKRGARVGLIARSRGELDAVLSQC